MSSPFVSQRTAMRLTIEEYSKKYKISQEILHSKIRLNKLNYITENGITYIVVPEEKPPQKIKEVTAKPKITVATLIELYKRENKALKEKIVTLEKKIDSLVDDKEQMLRQERERIEKIYATKDEQLKNILELISTKLQLEQQNQQPHHLEILPEVKPLVELKEYLKSLELEPQERKAIKKHFQAVKGEDIRVQEQNGKIYLDFNKYDYTDLLKNR